MADEEQLPERVLVVTAHPDDVDFGSAGSVATWTDAGVHVTYCIVTDGDAGGFDATISRAEMAEIRRAEQTTAAKHVGVSDLVFLGYPDGRVEPTLDLRRDISRVIRQVRPQRVVSQSPERNYQRASTPAIPTTWRRGRRRCARSTRTRAISSRTPSCSKRAWSHGRCPKCGWRPRAHQTASSTSPT